MANPWDDLPDAPSLDSSAKNPWDDLPDAPPIHPDVVQQGERFGLRTKIIPHVEGTPYPEGQGTGYVSGSRGTFDIVRGEPGTPSYPVAPVAPPIQPAPPQPVPLPQAPVRVAALQQPLPATIPYQKPGIFESGVVGAAEGTIGTPMAAGAGVSMLGDYGERVAANLRGAFNQAIEKLAPKYYEAKRQSALSKPATITDKKKNLFQDVGQTAYETYKSQLDKIQQTYPSQDVTKDPWLLLNLPWLARNTSQAATSMAGGLIMGGGTPIGGAIAGAGMEALPNYEEMKGEGLSNQEAFKRAATFGAIVAGLEKFGLDKIFKGKSKSAILNALKSGLSEGASEAAEEPADTLTRLIGREGITTTELGDQFIESLRRAANVAPGAFLIGGGMGGANSYMKNKQAAAEQASQEAATVDTMARQGMEPDSGIRRQALVNPNNVLEMPDRPAVQDTLVPGRTLEQPKVEALPAKPAPVVPTTTSGMSDGQMREYLVKNGVPMDRVLRMKPAEVVAIANNADLLRDAVPVAEPAKPAVKAQPSPLGKEMIERQRRIDEQASAQEQARLNEEAAYRQQKNAPVDKPAPFVPEEVQTPAPEKIAPPEPVRALAEKPQATAEAPISPTPSLAKGQAPSATDATAPEALPARAVEAKAEQPITKDGATISEQPRPADGKAPEGMTPDVAVKKIPADGITYKVLPEDSNPLLQGYGKFWMTPEGKWIASKGEHGRSEGELSREGIDTEDLLRVGSEPEWMYFAGSPTPEQFRALRDVAIRNKLKLMGDDGQFYDLSPAPQPVATPAPTKSEALKAKVLKRKEQAVEAKLKPTPAAAEKPQGKTAAVEAKLKAVKQPEVVDENPVVKEKITPETIENAEEPKEEAVSDKLKSIITSDDNSQKKAAAINKIANEEGGTVKAGNIATISKNRHGSGYRISVGSSKSGRSVFLDNEIRKVTGDFVKTGNRMVAEVRGDDLAVIADRIMYLTSSRFRPEGSSRDITEDVKASNDTVKSSPAPEKKTSKRTRGLPPGVGAAAATTTDTNSREFYGDVAGAKHAYTEAMRERQGMLPRTPTEVVEDETLMNEMLAAYQDNPSIGRETMDKFKDDPELVPTALETVILEREVVEAEQAANDARSANDNERIDAAMQRVTNIYDIVERAGSEAGRAFRARQFMMNADFEISRMEWQIKKDKGGADLSEKERLELQNLKDNFDAATARVKELQEEIKTNEEITRAKASIEFDELVKIVDAAFGAGKPKVSKKLVILGDDMIASSKAYLSSITTKASASVDPMILYHQIRLGTGYMFKGLGRFMEWSSAMRSVLKDSVNESQLQDIWKKSMVEYAKIKTEERKEEAKRKRPDSVTPKKEPVSIGKDLTKEIKQLFRRQVEDGFRTLDDVTNNVREILSEEYPYITNEEIMSKFSDYGKTIKPSEDTTVKVLADLRNQGRSLTHLDRMAKKLDLIKRGSGRHPMTPKARELDRLVKSEMKRLGIQSIDKETQLASSLDAIKTRLINEIVDLTNALKEEKKLVKNEGRTIYDDRANELLAIRNEKKKQYDAMFPEEPLTPEQQLEKAIEGADRVLKGLNMRMAEARLGKFSKESRTDSPWSERLSDIKKAQQAVRDELRALKEQTPSLAIAAKIRRVQQATSQLMRRMENKQFTNKESAHVDISGSQEGRDAMASQNRVKSEYAQMRERVKFEQLNNGAKAWAFTKSAWEDFKTLKSSWDNSFFGRQGMYLLMTHPDIWVKGVLPSFKSMSLKESMRIATANDYRPNSANGYYKRAGLGLNPHEGTGEYGKFEDNVKLSLIQYVPVVKQTSNAFNRMYATAANVLRTGYFDALLEANPIDPTWTPDQATTHLRGIADVVNNFTAKGHLKNSGSLINKVIWAPSMIKAGWNILSFKNVRSAPNAQLRTIAAKEYARITRTIGIIYSLAYLLAYLRDDDEFKIEWDPRSSDFGSIPVGAAHKFNPISFVKPIIVILARVISGQAKLGNEIVNLRSSKLLPFATEAEKLRAVKYGNDMADFIQRFERSKLHPAAGTVVTVATGKTFSGEAMDAIWWLKEFLPMTLSQAPEMSKGENAALATVFNMANFFGFTMSPDYAIDHPAKSQRLIDIEDRINVEKARHPAKEKKLVMESTKIENAEKRLQKLRGY